MYATLSAISLAALASLAVAKPTNKVARLEPCSYDSYTPPAVFHLDFFLADGSGEVPIEFEYGGSDYPGGLWNIYGSRANFSYDDSYKRLSTPGSNNQTWLSAPITPGEPIPFYVNDKPAPGQVYVRKGSEGCVPEDVYLYDREGPVDFSMENPLAVWAVCQEPAAGPEQGPFIYAGPKGDVLGSGCKAGTIRVRRLGI